MPPLPLHFILYYEQNSTELPEASRRDLPVLVEAIRARNSVDTSVVGHSDTLDETLRRVPLLIESDGAVFPNLALAALIRSRGATLAALESTGGRCA